MVVRVLLDDVFTTADDAQLALLDSSPDIQVRVFNPLSRNSPLAMAYVLDFDRTNRRMHNKTFVVDGAMAIIGGRNIADEYFQVSADSEFADFDLFLAGPVIADITASFDVFWADPWSLPLSKRGGNRNLIYQLKQHQSKVICQFFIIISNNPCQVINSHIVF